MLVSINAKSASVADIEALLGLAEYSRAAEEIRTELKRNDLETKRRAQLFWLKAICHLSEDQTALAKASLVNLLATDPLFEPDANSSPKILGLFKLIATQYREKGALEQTLKTSFAPPEQITAGESFTLQIKMQDKNPNLKNARVEMRLRPLGRSEYSVLDFKHVDPDIFEATIPAILTKHFETDATFEYFIEMVSENGNRLGTIGKSTLPLTLTVIAKEKNDTNAGQESRKNFWKAAAWIGAATVAIGGVIAVAFFFSKPDEGSFRLKIYSSE